MVEVIPLVDGARPPLSERCVVFEWTDRPTTSFMQVENMLHYQIGQPRHRFWSTEAILLAHRLGFEKVYYIGRPSEVAWPPEPALRRPPGARRIAAARSRRSSRPTAP